VALDLALEEFARLAPRQAKVVELRYLGRLSEEEIAAEPRASASGQTRYVCNRPYDHSSLIGP
jgi:ECF sigma factor